MFKLLLAIASLSTVFACPQHEPARDGSSLNKRASAATDWTYEASYNWGSINQNYTLCQTGTQQSPIPLLQTQGLSLNHIPNFNTTGYSSPINGNLYNWGYGPSFNVAFQDITTAPTMTYDNETLYLKGWHIHAPADHPIQFDRAKAELHLVHANSAGPCPTTTPQTKKETSISPSVPLCSQPPSRIPPKSTIC